MSEINLQTNVIGKSAELLEDSSRLLKHELLRLNSIHAGTSSRVLQRRNLASRISQSNNDINKLIDELRTLKVMQLQAMERYIEADKQVNKLAEKMFPPKKNILVDVVDYVSNIFEKIDNVVDTIDYVLSASQALLVIGAGLSGKLKINYVGSKPTFLQRINGKYQFTVRADATWIKQKGVYQSKVASAINAFMRQSPSGTVMKKLHQFVSSYRSPSDLLKHAAGFTKNQRLPVSVEKQIVTSTKNMSAGILRRIPGLGHFIAFGTNASEFTDQSKGLTEQAGRFVAGFATEIVATAAGVKAGAIIGGCIGGPVGVIVGGAIGGIVGGVAGSNLGDQVKDLGGQAAQAIEKGISNAYSSISKWFT